MAPTNPASLADPAEASAPEVRSVATARKPLVRGLTRAWRQRTPIAIDAHSPASSELEPLVSRVLACRGLSDAEAAANFLDPSLLQLHDPSEMPGVEAAAERIRHAAIRNQPIVIYGDYDVDGITATSILWHTLRTIAPDADVRTFVPRRLEDGYGLNSDSIRALAADGAAVIVSVDCGITAIEQAALARELGVDLIITDHHNPRAADPATGELPLPDAFALVHPRLPGSTYPFGELSGAGVAYKLAWRIATLHAGKRRVGDDLRTLLLELLSLAALGTVADVVPLVGENRVITSFGLKRIKHTKLPGLRALIEAAGLTGDDITAERVGFGLAPRLNACGRMGHASHAVRMLTEASEDEARDIAEHLEQQNKQRRAVERRITDQATAMAEERGMTSGDSRAIVLAHPDWHPGVVGISCSRLVDKFGRPTILMRELDGMCGGSGRSIPAYSLHAGLTACQDWLSTFGGHDMAAGLSLEASRLDDFTDALCAHAADHLTADDLVPGVDYDCDAVGDELTPRAVTQLDRLAPFGAGNPSVRVLLRDVKICEPPRIMGKTGKHFSVRISAGERMLRLVAWNWSKHADRLATGVRIDAVVAPKLSTWQGRSSVEPELLDLKILDA
ncbi:MAG: single-stranded-DNA-specific exonuclease RecJ [Planctomycetota bacterium]